MSLKKILLVDDEPDIVRVMAFRLEKTGYHVVTASTGKQAVDMSKAEKPDIVLLDVMLPDTLGFEVCRRIKEDDPDRKVILYTAKIDGVDAGRAQECGADDFTVKTTDLKFILEAIQMLLGKNE